MADSTKDLLQLLERIKAEAYERGRRDALQAITTAAFGMAGRAPPSLISQASEALASPRKRARKGATVSAVRKVVTENPGLSGADVARSVAAIVPAASERTVRTSLRRLKQDGEIEQREGRWHPVAPLMQMVRQFENKAGQAG